MKNVFRKGIEFAKVLGIVAGTAVMAVSFLATGAAAKEKVKICHKPGTPAEKEMMVPADAVAAHLAHGDKLGSCGGKTR